MAKALSLALWATLAAAPLASAQKLKVDTTDNILKSASTKAGDVMALYDGGKPVAVPGRLPKEYNYWQGGALVGAMVDYWHKTNDSAHNEAVREALVFQAGNDTFTPANLMPSYLANDDQCHWALAAMLAAEDRFMDPEGDAQPWLEIAQSVFDIQQARIDDKWCKGGLRWGISPSHHGYSWKDSQSNGCFFNLAARLARYTGNSTYAEAATSMYDWMVEVGLVDTVRWKVYGGAGIENDCATKTKAFHSIDSALLTSGAAFMYNHTNGTELWNTRVEKLTTATLQNFFPSNLAYEPECELHQLCAASALSYKGVNLRLLAVVGQLAPNTASRILPALQTTAQAMSWGCRNGESGRKCQFYWLDTDPELISDEDEPKTTGLGEEMNALSAFASLLVEDAPAPAKAPVKKGSDEETSTTGGSASKTSSGAAQSESSDKGAGSRLGASSLVLVLGVALSSWVGSL